MIEDIPSAIDRIAALLIENGFRATVSKENGSIGSGASGLKFSINVYNVGVQFRCILEKDPESDFDAEGANAFNLKYRFGKLYFDEDKDIVMEADYYIYIEQQDFDESFKTILTLWEGLLGLLKEDVRAKKEP